jgi:hypothetical protein
VEIFQLVVIKKKHTNHHGTACTTNVQCLWHFTYISEKFKIFKTDTLTLFLYKHLWHRHIIQNNWHLYIYTHAKPLKTNFVIHYTTHMHHIHLNIRQLPSEHSIHRNIPPQEIFNLCMMIGQPPHFQIRITKHFSSYVQVHTVHISVCYNLRGKVSCDFQHMYFRKSLQFCVLHWL